MSVSTVLETTEPVPVTQAFLFFRGGEERRRRKQGEGMIKLGITNSVTTDMN